MATAICGGRIRSRLLNPSQSLSAHKRSEAIGPPIPLPTLEPDADDLAIVKRHYPDADPANPPWPDIEIALLAAGVLPDTIRKLTSQKLVRLLAVEKELTTATAKGVGDPPDEEIDRKTAKLKWLTNAMLLVQEHPQWPDAKIAQQVGRDRSTLSRNPAYKKAAEMARAEKSEPHRGQVTKDDAGRNLLEAYDESGDPANMDWDK